MICVYGCGSLHFIIDYDYLACMHIPYFFFTGFFFNAELRNDGVMDLICVV
jgi:hypothetical protein